MIACDSVIDVLVAYDDGELDSARSGEVEAHLADCPECTRELDDLRGTMGVVGEYLASPPETDVRSPLSERTSARATRRRSWPTLLAAAAGLLLVAGLGLSLVFGGGRADAHEITRQALEKLESCDNARYRLSFVLADGKAVPRGEVLLGSEGRSLVRYSYAGVEYMFGNDGSNKWLGIRPYPGAPGVYGIGADTDGEDSGMMQSRVPDLHKWMQHFKDEKAQLTILLREKINGRSCTAVRASNREMGVEMSVTFWIDDEDRWVRRVELDIPACARVRLDLSGTNVELPEKVYSRLHYAGKDDKVIPKEQFLRMFGGNGKTDAAGRSKKKEEF